MDLRQWPACGGQAVVPVYLWVIGGCPHGNAPVVHICAESVVKYGAKVNISGNDMLRRMPTSFTAYGVKRRWSVLCQQ